MPALTIVANIKAKADQVDLVKAELQKLIATTRAEAGCQQYDLHQDNDNPAHFLFFENWDSRDIWHNHMAAPHLEAFKAAAGDALEEITINEMTKIG